MRKSRYSDFTDWAVSSALTVTTDLPQRDSTIDADDSNSSILETPTKQPKKEDDFSDDEAIEKKVSHEIEEDYLIGGGKYCSAVFTKNEPRKQKLYRCLTCLAKVKQQQQQQQNSQTAPQDPNNKGILKKKAASTSYYTCFVCAVVCHSLAGHEVEWAQKDNVISFCSCSYLTDCKCQDEKGIIKPAIVVPTKNISFSVAEEEPIQEIEAEGVPRCLLVVNTRLYFSNEGESIIRIADLQSGKQLGLLKGHRSTINSLVDVSGFLFSASSDKTIREWNTKSGEMKLLASVNDVKHNDSINCLLAINSTLYSGSDDCNIIEWDLIKRASAILGFHSGRVVALTSIESQNMLFSAGEDSKIKQWDIRSRACTKTIDVGTGGIVKHMIAVHHEHTNHIKLFGALDSSVKDYSLNQQQEIANKSIHCWKIHLRKNLVKHQLLQGHDGSINSILISRRSKNRLFSGSEDATIHVRDVATGESIQILRNSKNLITCMYNTNDRLIVGSSEKTIRIWKTHIACSYELEGHQDRVTSFAIVDETLYSASTDAVIRVWNLRTGEFMKAIPTEFSITFIAAQDDKIFTASSDFFIKILDAKTGQCLQTLRGHRATINHLIVQNELLFSCSRDASVRMWNIKSGKCVAQLNSHKMNVFCLALSKNLLFSGSDDKTIACWDWKVTHLKKTLTGHNDWLNCLAVNPLDTILYSASRDQTVRLWNITDPNFPCIQTIRCHTSVYCLTPVDDRLYAGLKDGTIISWNTNMDYQEVLVGHHDDIRCLAVQDGILYSGSDDKIIRVWDLQILLAHPSFLSTCFSASLLEQKGYPTETDNHHRTAMMLMTSYGLIGPLSHLKMDYMEENKNGESAFYFALKNRRFELLKLQFQEILKHLNSSAISSSFRTSSRKNSRGLAPAAQWPNVNKKIIDLLFRKARADDIEFFKGFFEAELDSFFWPSADPTTITLTLSGTIVLKLVSIVDILAQSFLPENPSLRVLQYWLQLNRHSADAMNLTGINQMTLLHYSAFHGCPQATSMLLDEATVNVRALDYRRNTAIHVALDPNSTLDPLLSGLYFDDFVFLDNQRGVRSAYDLYLHRMECAKRILSVSEPWRQLDLFQNNQNGRHSFQLIVTAHNDTRNDLCVKKSASKDPGNDFMSQYEHTKNRRSKDLQAFENSLELISIANQYPTVQKFRKRISLLNFLKQVIPYAIWLSMLLLVAYGRTGGGTSTGYYFTKSIEDSFLNKPFVFQNDTMTYWDIRSQDEFFYWFNNNFNEAINGLDYVQNGTVISSSDFFINGHRLIGNLRIRQLRVRENAECTIPSQFGNTIDTCLPIDFIEEKGTFGPSNQPTKYFWEKPSEEPLFTGVFYDRYHGGGYVEEFNPGTSLSSFSSVLQQEWIQYDTRIVAIEFSIYNVNLNLFGVARFTMEFAPSGQLIPGHSITTFKALRFTTSYDRFLVFLEVMVLLFFFLEFIYLGIYQIAFQGTSYFKSFWSYFDIWIVATVITTFCLRIASELIVASSDLTVDGDTYVNLQLLASLTDLELKIRACAIGLAFLRAIKFLEEPEFSGVTARAIIDTITHKSFLAFVAILVFVVITFTITFNLAFGLTLYQTRDFISTLMTNVEVMFGELSNAIGLSSNRVFGPIFELLFLFVVSFVLLNMFIAVLSDIYVDVHRKHEDFWERHMTKLFIKELVATEQKYTTAGDMVTDATKWVLKMLKMDILFEYLSIAPQLMSSTKNQWVAEYEQYYESSDEEVNPEELIDEEELDLEMSKMRKGSNSSNASLSSHSSKSSKHSNSNNNNQLVNPSDSESDTDSQDHKPAHLIDALEDQEAVVDTDSSEILYSKKYLNKVTFDFFVKRSRVKAADTELVNLRKDIKNLTNLVQQLLEQKKM